MVRLAETHSADVAHLAGMTLSEVFRLVQQIPYRRDPATMEFLQRPFATLYPAANGNARIADGGDCDDKAIVIAAWAHLVGIPYRFIAASKKPDGKFHHVYPELLVGRRWIPVDATYSWSTLGYPLGQYTRTMVIANGTRSL